MEDPEAQRILNEVEKKKNELRKKLEAVKKQNSDERAPVKVPSGSNKMRNYDVYEPKEKPSSNVPAKKAPTSNSVIPKTAAKTPQISDEQLYEPRESDYYNSSVYGKREAGLVTLARKVESEENRMPRALAWAKKEIDGVAKNDSEKIKNNSIGYLKRLESQLDLKRKGNLVESETKLMDKLKKQQDELMQEIANRKDIKAASIDTLKVGASVSFDNSRLNAISKMFEESNQRLIAARREYDEALKTYMQYANSKLAQDMEAAKEIIKGIVAKVHSRACEKFGIKNPYNREELMRSLEDFGESEAAHMAENEYKTIYSGWGRIKKYAGTGSGYYKSASGGLAKTNDLIDLLIDGGKSLLFGPMIIGAIMLICAAWILETYGAESSSPLFLVFFFITIIGFVVLEMGRSWNR